jgi:hypothetical protein
VTQSPQQKSRSESQAATDSGWRPWGDITRVSSGRGAVAYVTIGSPSWQASYYGPIRRPGPEGGMWSVDACGGTCDTTPQSFSPFR